ncbi:MAG: NAD(P)-dependent oxidoreductase [Acidobacteriaceae bacterium]
MKVVLIGASGMIGGRVLKELISRGHKVVAVVRDSSRVSAEPGVTVAVGDVNNAAELSGVMREADAVVDAYGPGEGNAGKVIDATRSILAALRQAGVRRVIIVGGAASLFEASGVTLLDSGDLPEQWLPIAKAHSDLLKLIRTTDLAADLEWTYLSPAAFIQPGERTGKFRLGKDDLVVDQEGQSRISAEDYAIALVNELERPQHVRERFTVGY